MSIRNKLAGIVGLLLMPVILLAYLFVQQSLKDIEFAAKERDGIAYLRGAAPVLTRLVIDSNTGAVPAAKLKGPDLSRLGAQYNTAMEAVETGRDLDKALVAIGWPTKGHLVTLRKRPSRRRGRLSARSQMGPTSR